MKRISSTQTLFHIGWMAVLAIFTATGMMLAPFHGDEAMHIYTSEDYATAFLDGHISQLPVQPPYDIDSDPRLRLLNGSVMRYSIGLGWHLAGLNVDDLPPAPGWDWGQFYDQNVATGHRPLVALLSAARGVSTLYLIGSVVVMFGVGWLFGGRWMAYFVSGLYTLNPIVLLNGRRALVESTLLCFGLLTIWAALHIARRRAAGQPVGWRWWIGLTLASALTLASKYSGTVFVAGAFGGIFVVEVIQFISRHAIAWGSKPQATEKPSPLKGLEDDKALVVSNPYTEILVTIGRLTASGLLALVLVVALSPALWNDPIARVRDLAAMLQEQVEIVVSILPDAPTSISQRVEGIFTQSFMRQPQQFEQESWADATPIQVEIQQYMASPFSGLQFGVILGGALTLLAGFGLMAAIWPRLRPYPSWGLSVVLVVWLLVMAANLLINPLPWQRYYLSLIPITTVLAGIGFMALVRVLKR